MIHTVEHREGSIARAIEQQTAQLPSDAFLWIAGAAVATSLIVKLLDRNHKALFVGQWAPTILILGPYNKMVKQHETSLTLENLDPIGEVSRNEHSRGLSLLKPLRTLEHWRHCNWIEPGVRAGTNVKQVSQSTNSPEDRSAAPSRMKACDAVSNGPSC